MKNRARYCSHDANSRNDLKIKALIKRCGIIAYAYFWIIIETLMESSGYRLPEKDYVYEGLADEFNIGSTDVQQLLKCLIELELLESDGNHFWSNSLNGRMQLMEEKVNQAREAGKKSAEARRKMAENQQSFNVSSTDVQQLNKKKETKERKKLFTPPRAEEMISYFKENGYTEESARTAYKYYSENNWRDSKGNPVLNWKQKVIGVWFKEGNKDPQLITNSFINEMVD